MVMLECSIFSDLRYSGELWLYQL